MKSIFSRPPTEAEKQLAEAVKHVPLPPEHQHELQAIAVNHPRRVPMEPERTIVLFGCTTCPWVETSRLEGSWTVEQITRLHARPDGSLTIGNDAPPPCYGA